MCITRLCYQSADCGGFDRRSPPSRASDAAEFNDDYTVRRGYYVRILVWGLGYVGTVSAACLAHLGHEVVGIEPNLAKVEVLNAGRIALKEPGLEDLVRQAVDAGCLRASQNGTELVGWADVSLICVGTPSN